MDSNSKIYDIPNIVYHYTSPSGLLGIVDNEKDHENAKLWFTRCDSLNDKSERCDIQKVLKKYKELRKDTIPKEFRDVIEDLINTEVTKWKLPPILWRHSTDVLNYLSLDEPDPINIYICSFSIYGDSLPMWNYYSKSNHYEGYALGIDSAKWKENIENLNGYTLDIRRIIYQEEAKIDELDKIVSECNQSLEIAQRYQTIVGLKHVKYDFLCQIAELQFYFKDEHFSHENEVRAILQIPKDKDVSGKEAAKDKDVSNNKVITKYRAGNGYIIPYMEVPVPKEAITSVTVGPLLEKELAKKNVKEMLESRGYSCKVHTSEVPIRF